MATRNSNYDPSEILDSSLPAVTKVFALIGTGLYNSIEELNKKHIWRSLLAVFMYALKALESEKQYPKGFKMFLDFLKIPGDFKRGKYTITLAVTNNEGMKASESVYVIISYCKTRTSLIK